MSLGGDSCIRLEQVAQGLVSYSEYAMLLRFCTSSQQNAVIPLTLISMPAQLCLCPLPKLFLQSSILRIPTAMTLHPDWFIICPIDQLLPSHRCSPSLIQRTTLRTLEMPGKQEEEESIHPQPRLEENIGAQRLK